GAGGALVANRLTENPAFNVLLLEASPSSVRFLRVNHLLMGFSPEGLIDYIVPFFLIFAQRTNTPRDWNYTTPPQNGLNDRVLPYPRGRILGGCTSMNGMAYARGSKADWDRYTRVSGDPGWGWDAIQPYIRKNEHWIPPTDKHNETGQFNPAVHGFHGINPVSLSGFPTAMMIDARVEQVTQELPDFFPFNLDYNSGSLTGVSYVQSTIKHEKRSSSFTSYLGPEFIGRRNLHVLINAQVTRIIQTSESPKTFLTVEFTQTRAGPRYWKTATKEVILSAGTLETPKLLLNSGIGELTALKNVGIQARVDLPDVGKNMSAHVGAGLRYLVNGTDTFDDIIRNSTLRQILLDQWNMTNGGGPLGLNYGNHFVFTRLPSNSTILGIHSDPAAGPDSPHIQGLVENGNINPPPDGHSITQVATLVTPTSRGSIKLNTTDPFDQPLIEFGSLMTDFDITALREGLKTALKFMGAHAWQGYVLEPLTNITDTTSNADLDAFARQNASPNGHITGTASMSSRGAEYGVVDPDLLVKGVKHLRVVDASVMPYVPAANTHVPVYIFAERASDLIKAKWE
ncbi:aryl-alcohol-oxidase from pleurotus Eryingii, partial [Mycena capillaripes]